MIGLMLQFANVDAGSFLLQLEQLGFFQYILPFLLIFAVVYAILSRINVFETNKGAALVVALAVGLLSLQFNIVPAFFQIIFPNLGIGVSILLVGLILAGAFLPWSGEGSWIKYVFFGLGALIFFVVVLSSFASPYNFLGGSWWQNYGGLIVVLLVIIGAVIGVILSGRSRQ